MDSMGNRVALMWQKFLMQDLLALLVSPSISTQERRAYTAQLDEMLKHVEHLLELLLSPLEIAHIAFKNKSRDILKFPPEQVAILKQQLLLSVNRKSKHLYVACKILLSEPWPEFVPFCQSIMMSTPHASCSLMLEFIRQYQWVDSKKRGTLSAAVAECFPAFLILVPQGDPELLHLIFKMFSLSIRKDMDTYHLNQQNLIAWCTVFINTIQMKHTINDPDPERSHYWKAKKWAYSCLNTLFIKYARHRKNEAKFAAFSKFFMNNIAENLTQIYITELKSACHGQWTSNRVKQKLATYLENAVKPNQTWPLISQNMDLIVLQFIYPIFCFSENDAELWQDDPVEYIHKKLDPPMDDFRNPNSAAEDLLGALVRDKFSLTFMQIVSNVNQLLTQYMETAESARNPSLKYGMLRIMCCISIQALDDSSPIKNHIEDFLKMHVFPELRSRYPFLRLIALDVLRQFSETEFHDDSLRTAFQGVLDCIKDPELPVRVMAALTLFPYIKIAKLKESIKPFAVDIMHALMELTNQIDMDTLTPVMDEMVFSFAKELEPYAIKLGTSLCETFMRIMNQANFTSPDFDLDENEDKITAAMGIMKTLSSLLLSTEKSLEILNELQVVMEPVIRFVLDNAILDIYQELFEIIDTAIFSCKQISPVMWRAFPLIYKNFKTDAFGYLEEMHSALENYIHYGVDLFMGNPEQMAQLLDMIFSLAQSSDLRPSDQVRTCLLMEALMLNFRGYIDQCIPKFIQVAFEMSNKKLADPLLVHTLEIVVNAILYNPSLAISYLEANQATVIFLQKWFVNLKLFTKVHDKKLSILALITLLLEPTEKWSPSVNTMFVNIFLAILELFGTYPEALKGFIANPEREIQERLETGDYVDDEEEYELEGDDVQDENLEQAMAESIQQRDFINYGDDDDDDISLFEFMEENIYFSTRLDGVNPYKEFGTLMNELTNRGLGRVIEPALDLEKRKIVQYCLEESQKQI